MAKMRRDVSSGHCAVRAAALMVVILTPLIGLAQPTVVLESTRLTVESMTPGGEIVYLAMARERDGWTNRRLQLSDQVADNDHDGVVTVEIAGGVPPVSVWAVIDLVTGEISLASPIGPVRLRSQMLPASLRAEASGQLASLRVSHEQVSVLVARPGGASWVGDVGDGAFGDLDGMVDGVIDVDLATLQPVNEQAAGISSMLSGDAVVVIDGYTLEVGMARVQSAGS